MRIAVLTDIHGNYVALGACLKHAKNQNIDCEWINGNHSVAAMKYNYESLTDKEFDFFEKMPISLSVTFEDMPPILFCHGAPSSNNAKLLPDNDRTNELLQDVQERYIVCGHSHVQRNFYCDEKQVINVGAVGVALSGKGYVAQYTIFDSCNGEWTFENLDIEYDTDKVIKELHESGLFSLAPYWSRITIHLIKTGTISHGTVLSEAMNHNNGKNEWYNIPDEDWEAALDTSGIE